MSRKTLTLIHTALFSEAKPIADHFNLKQQETRPYKIFRGANLLLIISGVGNEAARSSLRYILPRFQFSRAFNIGMAGCSEPSIPVGTLIAVQGGPPELPRLPLETVSGPLTQNPFIAPTLVDMEANGFLETLVGAVSEENIHILKVVSDYLNDTILSKADTGRLIGASLPQWDFLADPNYAEKLRRALNTPLGQSLSAADRAALHRAGMALRFTHSELKNLTDMAADFAAWDERPLSERLNRNFSNSEAAYSRLYSEWQAAKNTLKSYSSFQGWVPPEKSKKITPLAKALPGFGRCPVASPRTRCCNLLTLDAVEGCGFDCSYCSIRYFYDGDTIGINKNILAKLKTMELDPEKTYHVGTGQSSDSLMWGNHFGILDGLLEFAAGNPNVILEFKTKSDSIAPLLSCTIPANVITTWSLNSQVIIANEEHRTASLDERLTAARKIADKGNLVGFHFHPMVLYNHWRIDYGTIISRILEDFFPSETAMVSFGTLTYIKPLIKRIRERHIKSRILQMPLEEIEGKSSYPLEIKREMFRFAYRRFAPWHGKVFFYLCMEDVALWPDVFGFAYRDNAEFEAAMIKSYGEKISR